MGISTHTLRNRRKELLSDPPFTKERIRREGGGRHAVLPKRPEWSRAVVQIIKPHTTGLPQNENVTWIPLSKTRIQNELAKSGYFKRSGKALSNGTLKVFDQIFQSGIISPNLSTEVTYF